MTTLYVQYCSRTKLSCTNALNQDVILCLEDAALLLNGLGAFAAATICQWYTNGEGCGPTTYIYTFSYDDAILADSAVPLASADITGVFCKDCLFDYFSFHITEACIVDVTTAELNALILASGLTVGCTYVVTDHVQGRIVVGNKIYLVATSSSQVASNCSVLTTYDTRLWRGVYDTTLNLLSELADNQGNVCKQLFQSPFFGPYLPIENFDWGNPNINNCYVENSDWGIDYGVAPADGIENVRLIGASALDLTGWTGESLYNLTIENVSSLTLAGSNCSLENVTLTNTSVLSVLSTALHASAKSIISDTIFNAGALTLGVNVYIKIEKSVFQDTGYISCASNSAKLWIRNSHFGRVAGLTIIADITALFVVKFCTLESNAAIAVFSPISATVDIGESVVSAIGSISLYSITQAITISAVVVTRGSLEVTSTIGSIFINYVNVRSGHLENNNFTLSNVYLDIGNGTAIATAPNINAGRDYFNNSII